MSASLAYVDDIELLNELHRRGYSDCEVDRGQLDAVWNHFLQCGPAPRCVVALLESATGRIFPGAVA